MPTFNVLCRIDAYADYVARVEADTAEEAAELAQDNHSDRLYVTLDAEGNELEATQVGDF
jgi:hypothetical protein